MGKGNGNKHREDGKAQWATQLGIDVSTDQKGKKPPDNARTARDISIEALAITTPSLMTDDITSSANYSTADTSAAGILAPLSNPPLLRRNISELRVSRRPYFSINPDGNDNNPQQLDSNTRLFLHICFWIAAS